VKILRRSTIFVILFLLVTWGTAVAASAAPSLTGIRFSHDDHKVRIVLDLTAPVEPKVMLLKQPLRLVIDLPTTTNNFLFPQVTLNDKFVQGVRLGAFKPDILRLVVDLNLYPDYKIFSLKSPDRLVIDIIKDYEHKKVTQVATGITYTMLRRSNAQGPVTAHILDIAPDAAVELRPLLSNNAISGLAPLTAMAREAKAIAAVNASYFATNGEILGLLKLDGEIVSTPALPRTALGLMPDGQILMDVVDYTGLVKLPDGRAIAISGVNRARGADELVLYNAHYGQSTATNGFGIDYVIANDKITAINPKGNSLLAPGTIVLSAHGTAAQALAGLKVGDSVTISQTLGKIWDQTRHAIGAGPRLVKDGSVYITTKLEEFGSDVAGGRAPRTAVGLTKEGHLLLVVVDGRQATSIGHSLLELALFMQELGAVDAMNLDGGGSSTMVIKNKIVNQPSDGKERRIGAALAVIPASFAKSAK